MPGALIVYSTRTGQTKKIANLIAEGLRFSAIDVKIAAANDIKKESDLTDYDSYIFGSSTYHGEMMNSMKTLLFLAEKANLSGKTGGSFGGFGWSGEAPGRIYDTMENIFNMNMAKGPLMLKSADLGGGINMAQDYGKEIAGKMGTT